jgi:hypothetical protein
MQIYKKIANLINIENNKKRKEYIIIFFLFLLIIINFLLIHKYNIFIGDDTFLLTFVNKFNFLDKEYSILCEKFGDNQLLIKILGPLYKIYFGNGIEIINFFNFKLIWIRFFSFILFLLSFFIFAKIAKISKYNYYFLIIFLTLEPFLVMSHSIRHDIIIFIGIVLFFYCTLHEEERKIEDYLILFLSWNFLITHPSGYPFLIISGLYELIFNKKKFFYSFLLGLLTIFIFFYQQNLLRIENIKEIIKLFSSIEVNIGKENAFTVEKFYDYFWLAKYKRHLAEIIIFLIYLANFFYFNKLSTKNKFILITPLMSLIIYYLLNYFNVSYLKHIYLTCIICTILISKKINFNKLSNILIIYASILYFLIFVSIAIIFIPHNTWNYLYDNNSRITHYFSKNKIVSGPLYLLFLDKKINFIPISALGNNNFNCFMNNADKTKIDTIILDTQIINKIKNNDKQYLNLHDYLKKYKFIERIYIGRLATQNLEKDGFIYIYSKK